MTLLAHPMSKNMHHRSISDPKLSQGVILWETCNLSRVYQLQQSCDLKGLTRLENRLIDGRLGAFSYLTSNHLQPLSHCPKLCLESHNKYLDQVFRAECLVFKRVRNPFYFSFINQCRILHILYQHAI